MSEEPRRSSRQGGDESEGRPGPRVVGDRPVYVTDDSRAPSVLELLNVVFRYRRLLLVLPLAVAAVAVAHGLLSDPTYSSSASFMSQGQGSQISQLGGLAAQFGINLPDVGAGESPQFYADLLHSTHLLGQAVDTRYRVAGDREDAEAGRQGDLVELYEIVGETARLRRDAAIERLRSQVSLETIEQTGVVRFTVTTRWAMVSRQVADRLVELIQQFNVQRRQSRAEEERRFLEERVVEAQGDLLAVEDSLEAFLEENRGFQNSPALRFEHDRLQRRVSLQQQVYTSLAQSLEEAKIQSVRSTPVITVVEPPREPARPDSRMLAVRALLGLLIGGMMAVFWAFGARLMTDAREGEPDQYEEFERLRKETMEEIRAVVRRARRILGGVAGGRGDGSGPWDS